MIIDIQLKLTILKCKLEPINLHLGQVITILRTQTRSYHLQTIDQS